MSYQVIARKYRPQRFSDVVGQEHVTQTLAHAIEQNRIAHAYLFCGPRGTGKTTIARIFAKCVNCTDGPQVNFPDDDPKCLEITEGRSIDVLEIDGASNNGVEQVRELRETAKYAPASSRCKIYIIDEVHMLTTGAFNALLKTLEEPPEHVKFLFATTDPEKVLATILSRCQRFDLRRIPVALIVEHLTHIAKKEKVKIEEAALFAIARGADGGMRDAESALDQLISFCGDKIVETDVLSMFGLTAQRQVLSLTSAVLKGEAQIVLHELNDLAKHGKDLGRLLGDLLSHFRNLLVYQVSQGDTSALEISEAENNSLQEQSALADTGALTRIMEVLSDAEGRLRNAASRKIFLEVTLLKAIQACNAVSIDAVLRQLNQLRSEPGAVAVAAPPAPQPASRSQASSSVQASASGQAASTPPAPASPRIPASAESAQEADAAQETPPSDLAIWWQNVMEAVGRASAFTRTYLLEARPLSFDQGILTLGYDPEYADQLDMVDNPKTHSLLQTKLKELGQPNVRIKFVKSEAPPLPTAPPPINPPLALPATVPASQKDRPPETPTPASTQSKKPESQEVNVEDFKNDPLIRKALEIFKGQIVQTKG